MFVLMIIFNYFEAELTERGFSRGYIIYNFYKIVVIPAGVFLAILFAIGRGAEVHRLVGAVDAIFDTVADDLLVDTSSVGALERVFRTNVVLADRRVLVAAIGAIRKALTNSKISLGL